MVVGRLHRAFGFGLPTLPRDQIGSCRTSSFSVCLHEYFLPARPKQDSGRGLRMLN